MLKTWVVRPTGLPTVLRACHRCASSRFRTDGTFRVNAHHKRLDVWLLALCASCEETAKLTILERRHVRSIRPELLERMRDDDPALAFELLQDPAVRRRNRIALDWAGCWRLDTGGPSDHQGGQVVDAKVRFAARIPLRPVRLIAEGCGLSRSETERSIDEGRLVSATRLNGRRADDFAFTLTR
ncbi:hypothetical protein BIV57_01040 [Mangrovactinospora gilvigrisea]|uniref:DUF1062 domain-containing protein n=1 Tax=Mangrovactinospora gilvigrisea TaxID=1428644 RepID=A0A1J7BL72_9ACTN|nr:DUF1062 domain-containing protein [Mangrovactinospora gilvigrisea]OIV39451.1 hypothetical protein BIV57_01040 [Mangrovactinospora gilvigrisea]